MTSTMPSNHVGVVKHLQRLQFSDCIQEALKYVVSLLASQDGTCIPGLNNNTEAAIEDICNKFIFRTKQGLKIYGPLQELQLLASLCECFSSASEKHKYRLFRLLFLKSEDTVNPLLNKMVSMALSVSCASILDCTAIWMQERGCHNMHSLVLTRCLVEDYCLLLPDPSNVFRGLPSISPLFACNLTTSVTTLYDFHSLDTIPPSSLLEHVTSWVTSDCTLCCESVRQLAIHGTCSSPIPGLLAWCVLGPSVCSQIPDHAKEEELCSANRRRKIRASRSQLSSTLSRLHLGVLQSLDFSHTASMSQCIMSVSDVICLLNQLALLGKQVCEVGSDEDVFNLGTDRLAHGFQMAHAAGCLLVQKGSITELSNIAKKLMPSNRLFSMVISESSRNSLPRQTPMDVS